MVEDINQLVGILEYSGRFDFVQRSGPSLSQHQRHIIKHCDCVTLRRCDFVTWLFVTYLLRNFVMS